MKTKLKKTLTLISRISANSRNSRKNFPSVSSILRLASGFLRWAITCQALRSLAFLYFSLSAFGLTPIVYNASDFTGTTNNLPVTLTSLMKVQVNNRTMLVGLPINFTPTNGTYTTNVYAGIYNLTIQGIPSGVTCLIPDTTNAQTLATCVISNLGLFSATNLNALITNQFTIIAGTNVLVGTNGFAFTIAISGNLVGTTNGFATNLTAYGTFTGNGNGLTNLNAANLVAGSISQTILSNSGGLTYSTFNSHQFGTNGGTVYLPSGVTITNPAISGIITNVAVSNATFEQVSTLPTNFYTATGTLSGTNGKNFFKGSTGAFSGLHIGDNILIGTAQFLITSITNANDTVGIYPFTGNVTNTAFVVYPNAILFRDINGTPIGGIGNDGSLVIYSYPAGNSGKIALTSTDGANSFILALNSTDALGPALNFTTSLNNQTGGCVKIYNNVQYDTLDVCPDPTYGGAVSVRAMTNLQGTTIPFRVGIQAGAVTANTLTTSNAPTFQATNATPGGWTAGTGATAPRLWLPFTNNGSVYYLPGY